MRIEFYEFVLWLRLRVDRTPFDDNYVMLWTEWQRFAATISGMAMTSYLVVSQVIYVFACVQGK